jgi:hypothetical protein
MARSVAPRALSVSARRHPDQLSGPSDVTIDLDDTGDLDDTIDADSSDLEDVDLGVQASIPGPVTADSRVSDHPS